MKEVKNNMSKMTTINTTYARICILLLAVNFVLTGYAITEMAKLQTASEQTPVTTTAPQTSTSTSAPSDASTSGTEEQQDLPAAPQRNAPPSSVETP